MRVNRSAFLMPLFCTIAFFVVACSSVTDEVAVINLKTEYLVNPLGIDETKPRFTWQILDEREGAVQTAFRITVGTDSADVSAGRGDVWNSLKISGCRNMISYKGLPLEPFTKYYWQVETWDGEGKLTTSPGISWFETGMLNLSDWKGYWISDSRDTGKKPAGYFRKSFNSNKNVKDARIYITAGGYFDLYINGRIVGDHMLDPVKTRYDRRIKYVTHDVTSMINSGENAIGVILGNGWFNHQSTAVWFFDQVPWRARPSFCADLRITYEDGSVEIISTGDDWKTSTGEIIFNSIYTGEHHDARLKQEGWSEPDFDDSHWNGVLKVSAPTRNIDAQSMHPVRKTTEITPVSVEKISDKDWIFDLGRNISGVVRLVVSGEEGTEIRLRHGERLDESGRVDQSNIDQHYRPQDDSDPFHTDIFILSGRQEDVFLPRFNYKGFQYIEITSSAPLELTSESLTGYFMHSDMPVAGYINSSNETINKIWWAGNNSYLANMFGYPTDCPQREKLGWTGDGHIAIETGLFNFDGITVYEKWIGDHWDEQQPNGVLPAIIPSSGWGYHWANGVDWTSSIAIVPWNIYLFYGDSRLLERSYDNIKRYVDYIDYRYPKGLTDWGLGDWVPVKSRADVELTSTVYYYVVVSILASSAELFGKTDDYLKYKELAELIKSVFNEKFLDREREIYGSGFQTELSMPLFWGLVPDDSREGVAANLARTVEENNYHIDVGLLGSKAILNALSENGYADVAWRVASQESYPSWGWWIVNGATTFYENWSIDADRDISMNHIMFGEISAWFYKALGGINPDTDNPGFKNTILKPHFVEDLDYFEAVYEGPHGSIISFWERVGDKIEYSVTIPANSSGTLYLKGDWSVKKGSPLQVNDGGISPVPGDSSGVGDYTCRSISVIELAAGNYKFLVSK